MRSNKHKAAKIISALLVPPSALLLIFIFIAINFAQNNESLLLIIGTALLLGFLFPIYIFFRLRQSGVIDDNEAEIKEQRKLPYIAAVILSLISILILYFFTPYELLAIKLWLVYLINSIMIFAINRYWKISAHALGVITPIFFLIYLISIKYIFLFPIVILVGWSRYYLKLHTILQIVGGSVLGIVNVLIVFNLF
ncbi:MAG: hypothetical protein K8F36_12395 [Melioribacteraceae bacterium]|nr:hypothetical protein [Melioribacteraceae bacterium]MCO6474472.1 hypothetical protein [Melioribacteraceae bacterium]